MANWQRTSVVFQRFLQILFNRKIILKFPACLETKLRSTGCQAKRQMTLPWRLMAILCQAPGTEHGWNSSRTCWVCVIKTRLAGRSTGHSSNKRMENFISGHLDRYKSKWSGDHWRQQSCSWVQPTQGQRKNRVLCCRIYSSIQGCRNFQFKYLQGQGKEKEVIRKRLVKIEENCFKL